MACQFAWKNARSQNITWAEFEFELERTQRSEGGRVRVRVRENREVWSSSGSRTEFLKTVIFSGAIALDPEP